MEKEAELMAARIDLNDYGRVSDRARAFYAAHPEGSIRVERVRADGDRVVFKALVYRGPDEARPTTGWAYDRLDADEAENRRRLDRCQAAAIGRALANMNLAGPRRPSRAEMEKVIRMRGGRSAA